MQMFTVPDGVRAIIPAFQLDNAGEPRGDLAPLLAVLLPAGVDGWELWTWLTSPTSLLSGDIPDPTRCPVVDPARLTGARTTTLTRMGVWRRVYESKWGYDEFHLGSGGDSRFAPFKDSAGTPVPTLYLAESDVAALLETVFHDLEPTGRRLIYEAHLRERSIVTVALPKPAFLLDLRDPELARLGVARSEVASLPPEPERLDSSQAPGVTSLTRSLWTLARPSSPCPDRNVFAERHLSVDSVWGAHIVQRTGAGVAIPNSSAARDAITCRAVAVPDASCCARPAGVKHCEPVNASWR